MPAPSVEAPPRAALPVRLLATSGVTFLLIGLLPSLYGVAIPAWGVRFGLAEGQGSAVLAAQGAGAFLAVASGIVGLPLLTLRLGLLLLVGGGALLAAAGAWVIVLLGAFVAGIGHGTVSVVVNRRILTESGGRGLGMLGVVNAVFGVGAILAPLLFLAAEGRPGPVFWGLAVSAAVAALAAAPHVPGAGGPRGLPPLRDRRLLLLLFNMAGVVIEVMLSSYGASALLDLGFAETTAARLTSAFFAAFLAARLSLWWIAPLVGPDRLVLAGLAGAGACSALAWTGMPAAGYVLAGAFVGLSFPSFYVWGTGVLGGDPRMGSAVLTSGLIGATLGPLLLGPILARTGEAGVFPVMATLGLTAAAAFAPAAARLRRAAATVRA